MRHLFILALIFAATNLAASQTKTVTNSDLENFRQKRLKAERDYRENYETLGFPSPEELERQNTESKRELAKLARRIEAENAQNENYYKSRANDLLTEIASVDAQIAYLRGEVNRLPNRNYAYSFGYYAPNFHRRRQAVDPNYIQPLPNLANYQILINQYPYRNNRRPPINKRRNYYPRSFIVPTIIDDNSGRSDVVSQLRYLEQQRAGLLAEWRFLEEEAHKAGVKIN